MLLCSIRFTGSLFGSFHHCSHLSNRKRFSDTWPIGIPFVVCLAAFRFACIAL